MIIHVHSVEIDIVLCTYFNQTEMLVNERLFLDFWGPYKNAFEGLGRDLKTFKMIYLLQCCSTQPASRGVLETDQFNVGFAKYYRPTMTGDGFNPILWLFLFI